MATLDFFRSVHLEDPNFFDEGPRVPNAKPQTLAGAFTNTGSIDTSAIDGFRQGVELTQQKYFDAGLAKIHAGEPGHVLRRNRFGMDKNFFNDPQFKEIDLFNPVTFLRAQDLESPLFSNIITFPIVTSDNDQLENFLFDGVIEPFTIRARASFFSIDVPFEAHETKGAVMDGNTDITLGSDQVVTIYERNSHQGIRFLDQYADSVPFPELEDIETSASAHAINNVGFFSSEKSPILPFIDARLPRNTILSTNYDTDMINAVSSLSGSTDNYVAQNQVSATSGWVYDNNGEIGTDSLAFGGMVH